MASHSYWELEGSIMNLITKENITLLIAIWGALLATYKVLSDYLKNVRKLKVQVVYGFITQRRGVGPNVITITAINTGYREITLNSMGFILPDKKIILIIEPQSNVKFPYTLSEGKQCCVWQTQKELAEDLRNNGYSGKIRLRGYYRSATGDTFKSKPIDFDIESALTRE